MATVAALTKSISAKSWSFSFHLEENSIDFFGVFAGCWLLDAEVPAGYAFGINENDPVAVGHGVPRCFTAKPRLEHKIQWILAGSPTCWLRPLIFHIRIMGG